jgi:hypothetical protein
MHIDKAKPHNSALSLEKTEELGFTRLAQPRDSPDAIPCDFFLFDYLKKELHEKNVRSQNGATSVVNGSRDYTGIRRMTRSPSK